MDLLIDNSPLFLPDPNAPVREYLCEKLSYKQLFAYTDPGRKARAKNVRGPSLKLETDADANYWHFNFRGYPSTTGRRHLGYVKFEKPKNPDTPLEQLNCLVDCACFSGDTPVLMGDGTCKPIKDIVVGDMVYTHKGRVRKVTRALPRRTTEKDNVYRVKITGYIDDFIVTGEHPFYSLRGNDHCLCGCGKSLWFGEKTVSESTVAGTWGPTQMLVKKYIRGHYKTTKYKRPVDKSAGVFDWVRVDDFRPKEWFLSPWFEKGSNNDVDPMFARLVGYYISEGCFRNAKGNQITLTFNTDEHDTLCADVRNICAHLGYGIRFRTSNDGNWIDAVITSKEFKTFCLQNVGEGCHEKKLSPEIMSWGDEPCRQLFTGAILGDGWVDPDGGMSYISSNLNLVSQVSTILSKLRIRNVVAYHNTNDGKVNEDGSDKASSYHVAICRGEQSSERVREWMMPYLRDKDMFSDPDKQIRCATHYREEGHLKSLRSKEKIDYDGLVYDITVEEDESFIVHGVAVHNCPDFKFRWAWSLKQRGASLVGPTSYNKAHNRAPRITNPRNKISLCKHLAAVRDYLHGLIYKQSDKIKAPERLGRLVTLTNRSIINPPVGGEAEPVIANSPYFRGSPIQHGAPKGGATRDRVEPRVRSLTAMKQAEKERQDAVDRERRYGPIGTRDKSLQADLDSEASRWSAAEIKKKKAEREKRLAKQNRPPAATPAERKAAHAIKTDDQSHKMKVGPSLADKYRASTSESLTPVVTEMRLLEEAEELLAGADDLPDAQPVPGADVVGVDVDKSPEELLGDDKGGDESTKELLTDIRDLLKDVLGVDADGGGSAEPFALPDNALEVDLTTGEPKEDEEEKVGEEDGIPSPELINNDDRIDVDAQERPDDDEDEQVRR